MSESGLLTQDGKMLVKSFVQELNFVLESASNMDQKNLQTLGSILQKMVGDQISEKLRNIK